MDTKCFVLCLDPVSCSTLFQVLEPTVTPYKRCIEEKKIAEYVDEPHPRFKKRERQEESSGTDSGILSPPITPECRSISHIFRPDEEDAMRIRHSARGKSAESFAMIGLLRLLGQNKMVAEELQQLMEDSSDSLCKLLADYGNQNLIIKELEQTVRSLTAENAHFNREILRLQDQSNAQAEQLRTAHEKMALNLAHKEDELKSMERLCNSLSKQRALLEMDAEKMFAALKEREIEIERMYNQFDFERDYLREEIFEEGQQQAVRSFTGTGADCVAASAVAVDILARSEVGTVQRKDAASQHTDPEEPHRCGAPRPRRGESATAERRLLTAAGKLVGARRAHFLRVMALRAWSRFVRERQIAFSRREIPLTTAGDGAAPAVQQQPAQAEGARPRPATRSVETFADLDLQFGWAGRLNEIMAISLSELQELVCKQNLQIVNLEVRNPLALR